MCCFIVRGCLIKRGSDFGICSNSLWIILALGFGLGSLAFFADRSLRLRNGRDVKSGFVVLGFRVRVLVVASLGDASKRAQRVMKVSHPLWLTEACSSYDRNIPYVRVSGLIMVQRAWVYYTMDLA